MKNTELSPILFPVELKQIFFNHNEIPIPNYNAVVGLIDGEQKVFSVVTNSYKLITNQDAVVIGETLLKKVFHNTNLTEFKIFNVRYPTTKSFCHIDFIHKNYTFNIDDTEVFLPIIRITNSYNRTKALLVPPKIWSSVDFLENKSVVMVLADYKYDFKDFPYNQYDISDVVYLLLHNSLKELRE